jgi:hypothetical protein
MGYKYHTPAEYHKLILETEAEIDKRANEARFNEGLAKLKAYMDAHPEEVANDPMVKALRSRPASPGWGSTAPARGTAPTAQSAQPGKLPAVIDGNTRFHPSHLKMRPATPQIAAVDDPYVFSPKSNVRMR